MDVTTFLYVCCKDESFFIGRVNKFVIKDVKRVII